jgi:YHS domain-containing protein
MKRISMALLAGLMLLAMSGNTLLAGAQAKPSKPAPPRIAVRALDPIEFIAGREMPGDKNIFFDHNKLRYLFANQKNRALFSKDPGRYGIQGDGTCPVVPKEQANPDYVMVYKERIYAFASIGCMVPFGENPEKYLARWPPKRKKS